MLAIRYVTLAALVVWLGGMVTNFVTIKKRLGLLAESARRRRAVEALEKELNGLQRRLARLEGGP